MKLSSTDENGFFSLYCWVSFLMVFKAGLDLFLSFSLSLEISQVIGCWLPISSSFVFLDCILKMKTVYYCRTNKCLHNHAHIFSDTQLVSGHCSWNRDVFSKAHSQELVSLKPFWPKGLLQLRMPSFFDYGDMNSWVSEEKKCGMNPTFDNTIYWGRKLIC